MKGKKVTGLFEQVVKEMKSHPITLTLVLICLGATSFAWTTHAKASDVQVLQASLEKQNKLQTCRWLSDKIDNTENAIRLLEKDGAEEDWVVEKKKQLNRLKERYDATTCPNLVY